MPKKFDPKDYTMVKDRLKWYKEDHPDYRITTEIITTTENLDDVIVKAYIYKNAEEQQKELPHSTGIAEELREAGFINKTSHVENAETSAIGRALANLDYHGSEKRPSAEEMDKVKRTKKAKASKNGTTKSKKKSKPKPKKEKTDVAVAETDDTIEQELRSKETVNEVVQFFNEEVGKRKGKEKDEFREKYGAIANETVQQIKSN